MLIRSIPNILTFSRLVLLIPFIISFSEHQYVLAFYLFLAAGFTDAFDGWLARYLQSQSPLGSFIDPLADKLLVASSFIALALIGKLPWWLVSLVFLRDLTICLGIIAWQWLVNIQLDFNPTSLSKINTTIQLILVVLCLFELAFNTFIHGLVNLLIISTAITTAATYIDYVLTWGRKAYLFNKTSSL